MYQILVTEVWVITSENHPVLLRLLPNVFPRMEDTQQMWSGVAENKSLIGWWKSTIRFIFYSHILFNDITLCQ